VARLGRALGWRPAPLTVRSARRHSEEIRLTLESVRQEPRPPNGGERSLARARGLTAAYDEHPVLRKVDIDIERGEVVALMGRNGSGKTTLLRCLAGLHEPEQGRVSVGAEEARPGSNVALSPQAPETILFRDTVLDEVQTTLDASGGKLDAEQLLRALGIAQFAENHPRDLSAGQRLLVAVAAIAATGAPLLLLDEPTRGLDPESKSLLSRFINRWAGRDNAVMLATHDVELVAELAARVVILAAGEVIADGSPADVLGDSPVFAPQMSRVFGPGWLTVDQVAAAAAREEASL
jgi:energy-coupling factor transport system ATP-binding protein